ncbi:hypothetical protein [Pleionea sp. CnH1-48]|uniref:hypothetical protein n=1 Tax=Pleionea sp. CnH1-48 TaxID=2954494 RepID=UPI00209823BC|nr:hypothetical protein [Pleionea sp. CnH1-48]MCO7226967.1 hypothetical protein [Pleionea sp. CnH1-48]
MRKQKDRCKPPDSSVEHALNHNSASVYIAAFYCKNNRWPNDVMELADFKLTYKQKKLLEREVSWDGFTHITVNYFKKSAMLYSPEKSPGVYIVKSEHFAPICSGILNVRSIIELG